MGNGLFCSVISLSLTCNTQAHRSTVECCSNISSATLNKILQIGSAVVQNSFMESLISVLPASLIATATSNKILRLIWM